MTDPTTVPHRHPDVDYNYVNHENDRLRYLMERDKRFPIAMRQGLDPEWYEMEPTQPPYPLTPLHEGNHEEYIHKTRDWSMQLHALQLAANRKRRTRYGNKYDAIFSQIAQHTAALRTGGSLIQKAVGIPLIGSVVSILGTAISTTSDVSEMQTTIDQLESQLKYDNELPNNVFLDLKTGHLVTLKKALDDGELTKIGLGKFVSEYEEIYGQVPSKYSRFIERTENLLARIQKARSTRHREAVKEVIGTLSKELVDNLLQVTKFFDWKRLVVDIGLDYTFGTNEFEIGDRNVRGIVNELSDSLGFTPDMVRASRDMNPHDALIFMLQSANIKDPETKEKVEKAHISS